MVHKRIGKAHEIEIHNRIARIKKDRDFPFESPFRVELSYTLLDWI